MVENVTVRVSGERVKFDYFKSLLKMSLSGKGGGSRLIWPTESSWNDVKVKLSQSPCQGHVDIANWNAIIYCPINVIWQMTTRIVTLICNLGLLFQAQLLVGKHSKVCIVAIYRFKRITANEVEFSWSHYECM